MAEQKQEEMSEREKRRAHIKERAQELNDEYRLCTACYREGRTGDRFMSLCKNGQIQNCCHPNALMTLKEYLMDYASPDTREVGVKLIESEIGNVPNEKVRGIVIDNLSKIEQGSRDFRF